MKRLIIILVIVVVLVLAFYYYFANIRAVDTSEAVAEVRASKVEGVLLYNLDNRYPPTPREVVRFFAETTQCLYNETYNDADFAAMGAQIYKLYDEELKEENPWDVYLIDLRGEIDARRAMEYALSSYLLSGSIDVVYFHEDGYDYARLHCLFTLRQGTTFTPSEHQFLLRKDEDGRWKILGWQYED